MSDRTARRSDPITIPSGLVGRGAVLYDTREGADRRCCRQEKKRHLHHVTAVYEETTTGDVRFEVWDGTHTTREYVHGDDLLAIFEPAGWRVDPGQKPTYLLTRRCGVPDGHDIMTRGRGESDA